MVTEKWEGQHGHQGAFLLQPQSPRALRLPLSSIPALAALAWLQASLCLQGLCKLGRALQWGLDTGKRGPCRRVPSGLIPRGWWELWVGTEAPQPGALMPGPGG